MITNKKYLIKCFFVQDNNASSEARMMYFYVLVIFSVFIFYIDHHCHGFQHGNTNRSKITSYEMLIVTDYLV